MKALDVQRQSASPAKRRLSAFIVLSAALHGLLFVGLVSSARWLDKPKPYQPTPYSVSLVDAPLTLRQPPRSVQEKAPIKQSKPSAQQRSSGQAKTTPKAAPHKPPTKLPKVMVAPQKKTSKVAPTPPLPKTAKTKQTPKKKPKPVTSTTKQQTAAKQSTVTPNPQKKAPTSRQSQTQAAKTVTTTEQAQQRIAEQRLAALRSRYGRDGDGELDANATESLRQVRLRAYQARVREQIIAAWILPMPQDVVRDLQATALLTVDRDGRMTQIEILETSGNPLFDDSLLRAIRRAEPLPVLPEDYHGAFLEVELRFRPGEA